MYRSVTHVAIRVNGLREAERYYGRLFGLRVAYREAETVDGWRTLPEEAGWEDALAAGTSPLMCILTRDAFRLAPRKTQRSIRTAFSTMWDCS